VVERLVGERLTGSRSRVLDAADRGADLGGLHALDFVGAREVLGGWRLDAGALERVADQLGGPVREALVGARGLPLSQSEEVDVDADRAPLLLLRH
jgi:hypothetical protein